MYQRAAFKRAVFQCAFFFVFFLVITLSCVVLHRTSLAVAPRPPFLLDMGSPGLGTRGSRRRDASFSFSHRLLLRLASFVARLVRRFLLVHLCTVCSFLTLTSAAQSGLNLRSTRMLGHATLFLCSGPVAVKRSIAIAAPCTDLALSFVVRRGLLGVTCGCPARQSSPARRG